MYHDCSFLHFRDFTAVTYPIFSRPICSFNKRIVIIGGGAICAAFLPVLEKLVQIDMKKVTIIDLVNIKGRYPEWADKGVQFAQEELSKENFQKILSKYLSKGDILVELAFNIRTIELLEYCQPRGIMYFNTANYEWATVDESGNFSDYIQEETSSFISSIFNQTQQGFVFLFFFKKNGIDLF